MAVAGMHYDVMKQHGEPWAKLRGGRGVAGSKSGKQHWRPELIHMHPTCHMTTLQGHWETSRGTCFKSFSILALGKRPKWASAKLLH